MLKLWSFLAALVVAVLCGVNLVATLRRLPPTARLVASPPNGVMRHEARLAAARRALVVHGVRGTIGYLADLPPEQFAADAKAMEEYFMSQFALAPCVLDPRPGDWRWAVANLHAPGAVARLPAGFRRVEDCGDGVWLLQKTAP